jgi:hypothetical protein
MAQEFPLPRLVPHVFDWKKGPLVRDAGDAKVCASKIAQRRRLIWGVSAPAVAPADAGVVARNGLGRGRQSSVRP